MPKTKKPTTHSLEIDVVGLQYRLTTSTRRYLAQKIDREGPVFCSLVREPENLQDENAIKVVIREGNYKDLHMGYIQRTVAATLAPIMDGGSIEDEMLSVIALDVDKGTAEAVLEFTTPSGVKVVAKGKKKRKTA